MSSEQHQPDPSLQRDQTTLHCKAYNYKYLTWIYKGTPFAVVNRCSNDGVLLTFLGNFSNFTFSVRRNKLTLLQPYFPGIYTCLSGPCNHTFHLIENSTLTFPAPIPTNSSESNSSITADTNTPKTGGELRSLPPAADNPWVVAGFVALGIVAGGLAFVLCYLYLTCCSYLVVLCCWFRKWGRY